MSENDRGRRARDKKLLEDSAELIRKAEEAARLPEAEPEPEPEPEPEEKKKPE